MRKAGQIAIWVTGSEWRSSPWAPTTASGIRHPRYWPATRSRGFQRCAPMSWGWWSSLPMGRGCGCRRRGRGSSQVELGETQHFPAYPPTPLCVDKRCIGFRHRLSHPSPITLLDMVEGEVGGFLPAQATADEHGQDGRSLSPFKVFVSGELMSCWACSQASQLPVRRPSGAHSLLA
jgi:hypothetical protein